ncbi:MAG: KH domain-containing protein [Candidatus Eremiobacteraeota bacterium]|nr:KH domain-containing protein [Candidatus Eremiobacteraeota bacterium]
MSAFDDEFGLFGDETAEEERKSTLGARKIATGSETIIDEIEPEDEPARFRNRSRGGPPEKRTFEGGPRFHRREAGPKRDPIPVELAHQRATDLLSFLAKKLVSNPDVVAIELHPDDRGAVLELEVDPDDLGKVIGRGGRVSQALRTLVRAAAEGRVTVDILDIDEDELEDEEDEATPAAETSAAEQQRP